MKIAIVGSMGVGKTTLARELGKRTEIKVLPEVARVMEKNGHKLDGGATPALELKMADFQGRLERGYESWIADRCMIDVLAYSMVLFGDDINMISTLEKMLDKAKYDIIFYIPIEFRIENDGVRSTDVKFQMDIDKAIKKVLESEEYFTIKGSVEQRVEWALKLIKRNF